MIVIIGIGNEYRRDDAAGLIALRRLRTMNLPGVEAFEAGVGGVELIEVWRDAGLAILIDAVSSGTAAGTIHRLDAIEQRLPSRFFRGSTHDFGVAEAVELARALDRLPQRLIVYGIEGKDFASGVGLSAEVEEAVEKIMDEIVRRQLHRA